MAHPAGHHHDELVNPDGSWKFTNALSRESSPYLLQHAHNPVDWHPWGSAAFGLARRSGKPIFLSIGYSTCYWCHVMERQVFENPKIAALMNEHFINVKVDREERPDVDDIYMIAVQLMTGHGGWPMSVFLTPPGSKGADDPGLRPFYAGTYFPPEPARGMPGFPQIVLGLSQAWRERREEVIEQGDNVASSVASHLGKVEPAGELSIEMVRGAANGLLRSYDAEHGGFGSAPKFPTPGNLFFLMRLYRNNADAELWRAISHTLDRMARGGMYDQIGGGFHRYSTDERWLVPHFEKMLYDNGQLVEAYCVAQELKPVEADERLYPDVIRGTCEYVLREMVDPLGPFWSAQDAEVDAMEGGNYVWTAEQVLAALGEGEDAKLALAFYGLDAGPNFRDPHHPDAEPVNVLYQPTPLHEFAHKHGLTPHALRDRMKAINARLLIVRDRRKQPGTDDKVLVAWNGMMIAALALASKTVSEPRYLAAAERAARYILDVMRSPDGGLWRTMRDGQSKIPAFLDDYAYLIHGLIELHRASADTRWLEDAIDLLGIVETRFGAGEAGGYFDTLEGQSDLFVRTRGTYDGAIPSGNSQMVHNLLDLHELTGDPRWLEVAYAALGAFCYPMRRAGTGMPHMHQALLRAFELAPGRVSEGENRVPPKQGRRRVVDVEVDRDVITLGASPESLAVTLHIGPEYHVNANDPGDDSLIATEILLEAGEGIAAAVEYPEGMLREFPFADKPIRVYQDRARIVVTLRRTGDARAGADAPRLMLRFQVCTDASCLEPRSVELPVAIHR